ncbi:MAG: carbohydrate ABC transporter substrate-binding protein [Clostridiales bacterium]|jgi:oligogalacturonide transport system substrate-binding protein|nr:carbohydrate ABC transporter substrate-binding protein [Clostridiales bacterium]
MKKTLAIVLALVMLLSVGAALAQSTVTFSWWGGDARHEATQKAVEAFMAKNPDITVVPEYSAWSGWEDKMGQRFASNSAPDVNQINWNWITAFSADGSKFVDLNTLSDIIDLSQFSKTGLDACTVAGKLQGIPVSMTGRILYWNQSTYEKAGLAVPTSYAELLAAGPIFQEKLGEDYYPLVLGTYDRAILMVYYLESVFGKDWVVDNKLNYTAEEIQKGFEFIAEMEANHVIPTMQKLTGDGADSLDKNVNWMEGKYAGIFEWDSAAGKFQKALNEGQTFVVGDYFRDFGEFQGGFAKVSMAFAISETAADKVAAAKLINFLLNDEEGIEILESQRGIPLSKKAFDYASGNNLLDPIVSEANAKVLSWVNYNLDPKFESNELKAEETGVYAEAMNSLSYGVVDVAGATEILMEGINRVLGE